jgi:hypothetical protein
MKIIKVKSYKEIPDNFTGIVKYPDESKEWYEEGKIHREDGPAIEYLSGSKEWVKDGKFHRDDGPACEYSNGIKKWYKNGELHREDGPAIEYPSGASYFYLEEKQYSKINLNNFVVLGYDKGKCGIMWYRLLDKNQLLDHPDIPGLIEK